MTLNQQSIINLLVDTISQHLRDSSEMYRDNPLLVEMVKMHELEVTEAQNIFYELFENHVSLSYFTGLPMKDKKVATKLSIKSKVEEEVFIIEITSPFIVWFWKYVAAVFEENKALYGRRLTPFQIDLLRDFSRSIDIKEIPIEDSEYKNRNITIRIPFTSIAAQ